MWKDDNIENLPWGFGVLVSFLEDYDSFFKDHNKWMRSSSRKTQFF